MVIVGSVNMGLIFVCFLFFLGGGGVDTPASVFEVPFLLQSSVTMDHTGHVCLGGELPLQIQVLVILRNDFIFHIHKW